jgi:hypothetical protein
MIRLPYAFPSFGFFAIEICKIRADNGTNLRFGNNIGMLIIADKFQTDQSGAEKWL